MLASVHNRLLHIDVDRRLDRAHEPRAHIDALGPERQRGRQPLPVREPARGDERHAQALPGAAQQDEVRDLRTRSRRC